MGLFVGMCGLTGFFVCLVFLIIHIVQKKPKKVEGIGLIVCVAAFFFGVSITPVKSEPNQDYASVLAENQSLSSRLSEMTIEYKTIIAEKDELAKDLAEVQAKCATLKKEIDKLKEESAQEDESSSYNSVEMTLAEFNQISTGMTYDEVVSIVGGKGTVTAQSDVAGYYMEIISWTGNGSIGANANVTFMNDEVEAKAQFGLK